MSTKEVLVLFCTKCSDVQEIHLENAEDCKESEKEVETNPQAAALDRLLFFSGGPTC